MLKNNGERLKIWLALADKFDFIEYSKKCVELNVLPHSMVNFAKDVGVCCVAQNMFPTLPLEEAYALVVPDGTDASTETYFGPMGIAGAVSSESSVCCGGGKVV